MSYSHPDGPTITIPNAGTDSPAMITDETISDAESITIKAPAALTGAVTIQISFDFDRNYRAAYPKVTLAQATAAATWVATPAASAVTVAVATMHLLDNLNSVAWRLHSTLAEGADRVFRTVKRTLDS